MVERKTKYKDRIPIGPPRLTIFEKARIIGIRAIQIDFGAEPFIPVDGLRNSIEIAKKELESGVLPLSIKRKLPFRDDFPPIPVKWLIEAEKEDLTIEL